MPHVFRRAVYTTKRNSFEERIYEISYANKRLWDLINWVCK